MINLILILAFLPTSLSHPVSQPYYPPGALENLLRTLGLQGDPIDQYCSATKSCKIVAFGNSITDDGLNPLTGDKHGFLRYSNGPVWVDYLANDLGLPCNSVNNMAYSGALSGDGNYYFEGWSGNLWQVDQYLLSLDYPSIPETTLIAFEAGGLNDLFLTVGVNDSAVPATEQEAVDHAIVALEKLIKRGAKRIIFVELADDSNAPYFQGDGLEDYKAAFAKGIANINAELEPRVAQVQADYPNVRLVYVKFGLEFFEKEVLPNFVVLNKGFTHHKTDTRVFEPMEYLWYDEYHPGTLLHQIIGRKAYEAWMNSYKGGDDGASPGVEPY